MCPTEHPRPSSPSVRGRVGEELAAAHLVRLGYRMLARNVRTRHGEIDLIVCNSAALVFVEVKTRQRPTCSRDLDPAIGPLAGLRPRQRSRLRRLAAAWLTDERTSRPVSREIRFDAIGVTLDARDKLLRLEHLEGAW